MRRARKIWGASVVLVCAVSASTAQSPEDWWKRQNMEVVAHIGGGPGAIQLQGNYAYIGEMHSLAVYDVSNPAAPHQVGRAFGNPWHILDLFTSGPWAYTAGIHLMIFDVRNPSSPQRLSKYYFQNEYFTWAVHVSGSVACLANDASGLQLVDVSDPTSPTFLGNYDTTAHGAAMDVATSGSLAFVATGDLLTIDISNPSVPTLLSAWTGAGNEVVLSGNRAYVFPGSQLYILGLNDPTSPSLLGTYPDQYWDVHVAGNRLYGIREDLSILDVTDPTSPTRLGTAPIGARPVDTGYAVSGSGNIVYVTTVGIPAGVILVYDVSDPTSPVIIHSSLPLPVGCKSLSISDGTAFLGNRSGPWGGDIFAMDVGNPRNVHTLGIGSVSKGVGGESVFASGTLCHVATGDSYDILDFNDLTSPVTRSSLDIESWRVVVRGTRAYLPDVERFRESLAIFDVSDPTSPTSLGSYLTPGPPLAIDVEGNLAYVAVDGSGLLIPDVGIPSSPILLGTYPFGYRPSAVCVSGGRAYVTYTAPAIEDGYLILDVSNPSSPTLLGEHLPTIHGLHVTYRDIHVSGLLAYIPWFWESGSGGVQIFDVSNPSSPVLRGLYEFPDWSVDEQYPARAIEVYDDLVYVATDMGMWILEYTGPRPALDIRRWDRY